MQKNPYRHQDGFIMAGNAPFPSVDADAPLALLARCPDYAVTPLHHIKRDDGGADFFIKDERGRMGLGSFKALGAAYVIAHMAQERDLSQEVFITASAGNHGLSVAAGAKIFGAKAVIYLAETVPDHFADKLKAHGAEIRREGAHYEAAMAAAAKEAEDQGWVLLSDSAWAGYTELPHRLMEGYLVMAAEIAEQMKEAPSHIFLQAGVGGMAAACATYFRHIWGEAPEIYVVEPEAAPAIHDALHAGRFVAAQGPTSNMGRLDCKEASLIALNGLARDADGVILIGDAAVEAKMDDLAQMGLATTPSGGAGLVAALSGDIPFKDDARVLVIVSEGAEGD